MDDFFKAFHPSLEPQAFPLHSQIWPPNSESFYKLHEHVNANLNTAAGTGSTTSLLGILVLSGTLYDTRADIIYYCGSFILLPENKKTDSTKNQETEPCSEHPKLIAVSEIVKVLFLDSKCNVLTAKLVAALINNSVSMYLHISMDA